MTVSPRMAVYYRNAVAKLYRRRRGLKLAALACSLALVILFVIMKLGFGAVYRAIIQEDGPLENAQAAGYLVASFVSLSVAVSFARRGHASDALKSFALTVALMLICLEEVSWGQRVLGLPTPDYFKAHNVQSELTLHNLGWVNTHLHRAYIVLGLLCSLGWLFVRGRNGPAHLVPDWYQTFYFLPVAAVNLFFELCRRADALGVQTEYLRVGRFVVWRDQEPAELLLALGLLLLVVRNRLRQDSGANAAADVVSHAHA